MLQSVDTSLKGSNYYDYCLSCTVLSSFRCIYGFLRLSSVVILVTHQTQYLQHCDSVLKLYEVGH